MRLIRYRTSGELLIDYVKIVLVISEISDRVKMTFLRKEIGPNK